MKFKRALVGVASAALLFPTLAACGGNDDFCEVGEDIDSSMFDPNDPAAAKDTMQDLADQAPDEIKGDFEVMVEQLELMESDPASIDTAALSEAAENITTWGEENCES
ncbi:hypothetical protein [Ornithinicoccus hortensis]|uniref:Uncharacterized protein n=1 Tax=Ornithinicoccus hortensis TaxID=82346 RepID=A0A542YS62_9MICO|nr:hypothetical protein [Ornithinicoccus hortensis]TQL50920.1 hypothetical protein FB467_2040 [Ornithinicoccus hortensis]